LARLNFEKVMNKTTNSARLNHSIKGTGLVLLLALGSSFGLSLELILASASLAQATVAPTSPLILLPSLPKQVQPNSSSVIDNPNVNQINRNQVENPAEYQKIIQEMITPVAIAGVSPAPLLISQDRAKIAAEKLYQSVQAVLETEDLKLSYPQVNNTFDAYNNLIVLLGLTESAQIENFPRLKSIGLGLNSLREKIAVVKPNKSR